MDDRTRNIALGTGATVVGAYVMYHSVTSTRDRIRRHFHNDLRHQVSNYCSVDLNDAQWTRLLGSSEWQTMQSSMSPMGRYNTIKKIFGPFVMFSVGAVLGGFSVDYMMDGLLKMFPPGVRRIGTPIAIAFTFLSVAAGRLLLLDHAKKRLFDINQMPASHPVCVAARNIASEAGDESEIEMRCSEISFSSGDRTPAAHTLQNPLPRMQIVSGLALYHNGFFPTAATPVAYRRASR